MAQSSVTTILGEYIKDVNNPLAIKSILKKDGVYEFTLYNPHISYEGGGSNFRADSEVTFVVGKDVVKVHFTVGDSLEGVHVGYSLGDILNGLVYEWLPLVSKKDNTHFRAFLMDMSRSMREKNLYMLGLLATAPDIYVELVDENNIIVKL